jgi:hypothetical protein
LVCRASSRPDLPTPTPLVASDLPPGGQGCSRRTSRTAGETVTGQRAAFERSAYPARMRVHFYSCGSQIALYEHPRPQPEPGDYLGEVELSPEELDELHRMVDEVRLDS